MRVRGRRWLVGLCAGMCWLAAAGNLAAQEVSLDQLLTPAQQLEMGLYKLTPSEKRALVSFIVAVFEAGMRTRPGSGATPRPAPPAPVPSVPPVALGEPHWLEKNVDHGELLVLDDGSVWKVNPMDKIDAMLWLPMTNLLVVEDADQCLFGEYLIVNTDDGETACARPVGSR